MSQLLVIDAFPYAVIFLGVTALTIFIVLLALRISTSQRSGFATNKLNN